MKMIRAKVSGRTQKTPALFEPESELLKVRGLSMADVITEPDVNNCVTLIIQNESHEPIYLDRNQVLGKLSTVSLQENSEAVPNEDENPESRVPLLNMLQSVSSASPREPPMITSVERPDTVRQKRLLDDLYLNQSNTTEDQHQQLESLVLEYSDIFAPTLLSLDRLILSPTQLTLGAILPSANQ